MNRQLTRLVSGGLLLISLGFSTLRGSAGPPPAPLAQDAYGLIDAVNALRISQGLTPYSVSSTLMAVAQAHAEYMASTGSITHYSADGTRPYLRAMLQGYPLAGQIPPGFYSENIVGAPDLSPQEAVQIWTSDYDHMNTMDSEYLQEIGAGVAVSGGTVYYVIDAARPKTGGDLAAYTPGVAESAFSAANELIMPVTKSTPNSQGEVIHEVQSGQSPWQIATVYGITVPQLRALNALSTEYLINPGDTLLIMTVGTPTQVPATPTPPPTITSTFVLSPTTEPAPSPTLTPTPRPTVIALSGAEAAVGAIIVVALVAAALVSWAGRARPV